MKELQEIYTSGIVASKEEFEYSKLKYEKAVGAFLLRGLSEEEVVDFIGNNLLMSLILILRLEPLDLSIGMSCYDETELYFNENDICKVLTKNHKSTQPNFKDIVDDFCRYVSHVLENCVYHDVANLPFFIKTPGKIIYFTDYETEYLEEYTYSEDLVFKEKYMLFYERVKRVFYKNILEILEGNLYGRYRGLFDMFSSNYEFRDACKEAGYDMLYTVNHTEDEKRRGIEAYIAKLDRQDE